MTSVNSCSNQMNKCSFGAVSNGLRQAQPNVKNFAQNDEFRVTNPAKKAFKLSITIPAFLGAIGGAAAGITNKMNVSRIFTNSALGAGVGAIVGLGAFALPITFLAALFGERKIERVNK